MSKAKEILKRLDEVHAIDWKNAGTENFFRLVEAITGNEIRTNPWSDDFKNVHNALKDAFEELESRAMPEGMEWPRFEDGAPVSIGDRIKIADGEWGRVDQIHLTRNKCDLITDRPGVGYITIYDGKRVERPQVIAADGKPIEVGQIVYRIDNDKPYIVKHMDNEFIYINTGGSVINILVYPSELTHKLPVFAADGKPIHSGDVLYYTSDHPTMKDEVQIVDYVDTEKAYVWFTDGNYDLADRLTHTKPEYYDSWECIDKDKNLDPFSYCKKVGHHLFTFNNAEEFKSEDLVRRCKLLRGMSE